MENKLDIEQTYGSPRWTGEIADCSLPLTLDTYSNCSFGCVSAFSRRYLHIPLQYNKILLVVYIVLVNIKEE